MRDFRDCGKIGEKWGKGKRGKTAIPLAPSAMLTVVAALVAAGIIAPGTIFSITAMCFKPLLRTKLLQFGWRRFADLVVPDVKSDVINQSAVR